MRLAIMVVAALLLAGCTSQSTKQLQSNEIREYQGERLDKISAFRENSINGPQQVNIGDYRLEITGLVDNPINYTYEAVLQHQAYSRVVELYCVEGWNAKVLWEGVLLEDLIGDAGAKESANTVIFHAYDGYSSSLPLAYIQDKDIILAYKINGEILPAENGFPFQLVAEDKYGYKWVRWITNIELSDNPDYKGTWEKAGYSNNGTVGEAMFG
jgi:DMSO/TMAO reductase YedYZ molybdopterin-dependent catalytic subunit